ncbi:DUF2235 domain-containing protein [Bordetella sp. LUAb4]|uniref:T6SS phospholipase effector Tle1-like catalytic domain-containing protein n=1 Tax=Bordetella sp. LUAb4 TaxID=2843195 RepID=UPI001E5E05C3|nr:DUF2235 domain-containing protein [Bordetella sp. LUAb4]
MRVIRWPEPFNEEHRLSEAKHAKCLGQCSVSDVGAGCPQTLHVNLFFDGTNNNLDWDTRNKETPTHSNVARLYRACPDTPDLGIFSSYIPGVGTPFHEIGEDEFTTSGKALANGFGMRVAWGYTRLANALHIAMTGRILLDPSDARGFCSLMDADVDVSTEGVDEVTTTVSLANPNLGRSVYLATRGIQSASHHALQKALDNVHRELGHQQRINSSPGGRLNLAIKKIWVNVFGFSRGAASARVFVNRLINKWAPGGLIAGEIPYEVNFLGLFDTVASVGVPDSATAAVDLEGFDGHWAWTAGGALNVPQQVRKCVQFFSIHEQRMSFPLDSIREGNGYPLDERYRIEVAYPGVHSDVGGGYRMGEQGKSREGEGSKLSQITLNDMYIQALKAGVPLPLIGGNTPVSKIVEQDFVISPTVIRAFNEWLATVNQKPLDSLETALRIGMGQLLAWRTLRADIANFQTHVTSQDFFRYATEDALTPFGLEALIASEPVSSSPLDQLKREKIELERKKAELDIDFLSNLQCLQQANEIDKQIEVKDKEILDLAAGRKSRPGEGTTDVTINDQTDIVEAAEEFRLLLAYLRPKQRSRWQVYWSSRHWISCWSLGTRCSRSCSHIHPTKRFKRFLLPLFV